MSDAILTAPTIVTRSPTRRQLLDRRRLCFLAVGLVLAIGLGLRLWIMTGQLGTIDSDEALTGLMARHLWNGEFRAFMWRFNYQGTISTYPVALSLKLFGDTQFALELPFLIMSAGVTAVIWRVGTRFLTATQAVIAALVFWTWPAVFVWIGVKGLIFYVPTMLLGMSMILCRATRGRGEDEVRRLGRGRSVRRARVVDVTQRLVLPRAGRRVVARVPLAEAVAAALPGGGAVRDPRRAPVDLERHRVRLRLAEGRPRARARQLPRPPEVLRHATRNRSRSGCAARSTDAGSAAA